MKSSKSADDQTRTSGAVEHVTVQPRRGSIDVELLLDAQFLIELALGSGPLCEQ